MKHLLSSTAFIVLNKELAKQVGINAAILLADLISKEEYFIANGMTDGWFFNTANNIERDTTLSAYQQKGAINILKENLLIETKLKGIPATQYFKVNEEQVIKKLNNLMLRNFKTINKNKEIIIINKYFNKPSLLEIKNYCIERVNNVDPEAFFDFYESKGWVVGKSKMKDWKASIRSWERNETKKQKPMSKIDKQLSEYLKGKQYL